MKRQTIAILGLVFCLLLLAAGGAEQTALAGQSGPVANLALANNSLRWEALIENDGLTLVIQGPGDETLQAEFAAGEAPIFSALDAQGNPRADGLYTYELSAMPLLPESARERLQAAQDSGERQAVTAALIAEGLIPAAPLVQSGTFNIEDGQLSLPAAIEEETQSASPLNAASSDGDLITPSDQIVADDMIVQGSLCIGFDCVNNESFGFDTIRLKENNTRFKFDDTSSTAGFPANDWQITANDSSSGGASYLSIDDVTGSNAPFKIMAGAPSNSLYLSSNGNLGFGTSTPVLRLHLTKGDTPGMRLEQNNTSGYTAQTWDVAGNEANFFVRDVTSGSRLPFRIQPGAPTNTIYLKSNGYVGMGTSSPEFDLEIERYADAVKLGLTTNSQGWALENSGNAFQLHNVTADTVPVTITAGAPNASLVVLDSGNVGIGVAAPAEKLDVAGNLRVDGSASINGGMSIDGDLRVEGFVSELSDRDAKQNFTAVDETWLLGQLEKMPVTTWSYKDDPAQASHIGPTAQDFYAAFQMGSDERHIAVIDESGVALAAAQALLKQNKDQQTQIENLQKQVSDMELRLQALEARRGAAIPWGQMGLAGVCLLGIGYTQRKRGR